MKSVVQDFSRQPSSIPAFVATAALIIALSCLTFATASAAEGSGSPSILTLPFLAKLDSTQRVSITSTGDLPVPFSEVSSPLRLRFVERQKGFMADLRSWFAGKRLSARDYQDRFSIDPQNDDRAPDIHLLRMAMAAMVVSMDDGPERDASYWESLTAATRFLEDSDIAFGCKRSLVGRMILLANERALFSHVARLANRNLFDAPSRAKARDILTSYQAKRRSFGDIVRDELSLIRGAIPSILNIADRDRQEASPSVRFALESDRPGLERLLYTLLTQVGQRVLSIVEGTDPLEERQSKLRSEMKAMFADQGSTRQVTPESTPEERTQGAAAAVLAETIPDFSSCWNWETASLGTLSRAIESLTP